MSFILTGSSSRQLVWLLHGAGIATLTPRVFYIGIHLESCTFFLLVYRFFRRMRLASRVFHRCGAPSARALTLGKPSEYALIVESIVRNPILNGDVIRLGGVIRTAPR